MIAISYSAAFKALDNFIKTHNEQADHLSDRVRQSNVSTAQSLIRIYGVSLTKANKKEQLTLDNLPSLETSNAHLASICNTSTRTIQRHIKKLLEVGIIDRKKWHGSRAKYELWINPKILLASEILSSSEAKILVQEAFINAIETTENQSETKKQTPKCPHRESGNTGYKNNTIIDVDNSLIPDEKVINPPEKTGDTSKRREQKLTNLPDESGNTLSGNTGGKVIKNIQEAGGKKRKLWAEVENREMNAPDDLTRTASLIEDYVSMFWILARNVLYADRQLTQWQVDNAKKLIRKLYEPVQLSALPAVHSHYLARISWQAGCLKRGAGTRFVLLPHQYFDTNNPYGFIGTKIHYLRHLQKKKELRNKLITSNQIRRYANNLKKPPHKQLPLIPLYQVCEQRVTSLDNPQLLAEFHLAVAGGMQHSSLYNNNQLA